ncbi:MAG: hypothetical protein KDC61_19905 [Saprospiraceae bacterium]|nr:hypothetical protein [Saprospiraceae bacterium]
MRQKVDHPSSKGAYSLFPSLQRDQDRFTPNSLSSAVKRSKPIERVKKKWKSGTKAIVGKAMSLFEVIGGSKNKFYEQLLQAKWGELTEYWNTLLPKERVNLTRYIATINSQYTAPESREALDLILEEVEDAGHFPHIMANQFFEIACDKGVLDDVSEKLKTEGWAGLSVDARIVLLYDLSNLYPESIQTKPQYLFDTAINEPEYMIPLVVKEINRLALLKGNFEAVYEHFRRSGWADLTIDEKVILTNGLFGKYRGLTDNLDQVLYNLRVYREIPNVIIAEKDNIIIDRYLQDGITSPLIETISEFYNGSRSLITIKGIKPEKVKGVLRRQRATSS